MLAEYLGLLVILAIALVLIGALLAVQRALAPTRRFVAKQEPFESGESQVSSPRERASVRFYLVAILFVVLNVEAVYFYPWGASFRQLGLPGLIAIAIFALPLGVGLLYQWRKGALEW